jgi:anti-sigma factor RsiW
MDCAVFEASLPELVDGTLDDEAARRMAAHLGCCRACAALHAAHLVVGQSLSQAARVPAPSGFEARLFAAVAREEAAELVTTYRRQQGWVAAAVLAGLIPLYAGLVRLWAEHGAPGLGSALARMMAGVARSADLPGLWSRTVGSGMVPALGAGLAYLVEPVHLPWTGISVSPLCPAAAIVALGLWAWYDSATWPTLRIRTPMPAQGS